MTDVHVIETPDPTYLTWAVLGYGHPDDVIADVELTADEKRLILASWLSDRRAVENEPALRQVDSGAIVPVGDIMDALRRLDEALVKSPPFTDLPRAARRRFRPHLTQRRDPPDSDDDPPPCPAAALPPRKPRDDPDAMGIAIPGAMAA